MNDRINGVNRAVLALLGLLLLAGGGLGLAWSFGVFGSGRHPLLPPAVSDVFRTRSWIWWVIAVACLVLALLSLRWLLAQLRTDRIGRLDLTEDDRDGQLTVSAGALTDAVQTEVTGLRGVTAASAHLRDRRGRRLTLTVELADYADIAEVRNALEERVVAHARQAIDDPVLPVDIELRPGASRSAGRGLR